MIGSCYFDTKKNHRKKIKLSNQKDDLKTKVSYQKFHLKVEGQGRDDSGGQVKSFLQVGVSTRGLLPEKQNNLLTSVRIKRKAFKCNFLFSRIQTV
jgi:hypothetical protein